MNQENWEETELLKLWRFPVYGNISKYHNSTNCPAEIYLSWAPQVSVRGRFSLIETFPRNLFSQVKINPLFYKTRVCRVLCVLFQATNCLCTVFLVSFHIACWKSCLGFSRQEHWSGLPFPSLMILNQPKFIKSIIIIYLILPLHRGSYREISWGSIHGFMQVFIVISAFNSSSSSHWHLI